MVYPSLENFFPTMNSKRLVFTKNLFKTKFLIVRHVFFIMIMWHDKAGLCFVKSVYIQDFSGPYFPTFGLNTNQMRTEFGKIPNRKTPNTDTIHAVLSSKYVCFSTLKEHEDLENLSSFWSLFSKVFNRI